MKARVKEIKSFQSTFPSYLDEIKRYLKDISNLKKPDTWKIQLTIAISFISSKDNDEERVMYLKSDNIEFMIYDNEELFE